MPSDPRILLGVERATFSDSTVKVYSPQAYFRTLPYVISNDAAATLADYLKKENFLESVLAEYGEDQAKAEHTALEKAFAENPSPETSAAFFAKSLGERIAVHMEHRRTIENAIYDLRWNIGRDVAQAITPSIVREVGLLADSADAEFGEVFRKWGIPYSRGSNRVVIGLARWLDQWLGLVERIFDSDLSRSAAGGPGAMLVPSAKSIVETLGGNTNGAPVPAPEPASAT